jgi:hypothetical protein
MHMDNDGLSDNVLKACIFNNRCNNIEFEYILLKLSMRQFKLYFKQMPQG